VKEGGPANTGHAAAAAVDGAAARQVAELLICREYDTHGHGRIFDTDPGQLYRTIMIATLANFCIYSCACTERLHVSHTGKLWYVVRTSSSDDISCNGVQDEPCHQHNMPQMAMTDAGGL
jgi:hypothetical protein